jgi:hypothetical protein
MSDDTFGSKLPFQPPTMIGVPAHLKEAAESIINEKKKYWIFIEIWECPVCGDGNTYRERRYTPRPENLAERRKFVQHYDYCNI